MAETGPTRPNILFICTDQQAADAMSCAGHTDLDTPNLDALAARGCRFTNAYCQSPICGPSRAAMFSGEPIPRTGVERNRERYPDAVIDRTLGHLLTAAGYETVYAGKWHVPTHAIGDEHGFRRLCGYNDERVPEATTEFLSTDPPEPFCCVASFDNPHNICEWARNQLLPWGGVDVPTPAACPTLPTNFEPSPYEPAPLREYRDELDMAGASPDEWRQHRYAYFRLVERVDAAIGRILDALRDAGLLERTLVVFTSDHGEMNGAHRLQQKSVPYEESARIPLVLSGPTTVTGETDDRLVSHLDLVPTCCDAADAPVPEGLLGRSLLGPSRGTPPEDWREYVVTQCTQNIQARMVRTSRYKYVAYRQGRPREQLFDIPNDPGEQVNLAGDDTHADVLDAHRERLLEWCLETGDRLRTHYADGISDLPSVPGFEYDEISQRMESRSREL